MADYDRDAEKPDEQRLSLPQTAEPFGNEEGNVVKYRTLEWWQCGMIMIAETISLGILSLPSAMATLGLVPCIILIIGLGLLATYTGYVLGQFKLAYPHIHSMADAGEVIAGRIGREILGGAQLLFLVFIMGSHILTFTVMMNTLTEHGTCSIVFGVVGLVVSFVCSVPRTLKGVSWLAISSFISILAAVLITMIAIAIQKPGDGHVDATTGPPFYEAFLAVTNIVFAYAGHVAFFGFISEMKKPHEYPRTLYLLQGTNTTMYTVTAIVIYRYGGVGVASPALGSTSSLMSKIAYGIAIPTIVIAGVINGHVAAKYIYVRLFRGTDRMHQRSFLSWGTWIGLALLLWVIAWVIAEAIPVFNNLLSLITALFASWFTYGMSGIFWLYMNKGRYTESKRKMFLTVLNVVVFGIGACLCGLGLYVSGKSIHDNPSSASFTCADTSD
ncbi:amino acid transporter [Aspergillus unguis]